MAVTVGAVYVDVFPTTRDFVKQMIGEILPDADKAGEAIGRKVGEALGREAGRKAQEGIEEGVEDADTERTAARKGRETGGAFARNLRAEIDAALRNLPDVDIDGDPEGALADIAIIREQLRELSREHIGVDIDAEGALRSVAEIRAELEAIQDRDIEVDFDIRQATAALGQLEDRITRTFQDSQGSFARSIRGSIENAVKALPEIRLDVDTTDAEREIGSIRTLLDELGRKRIDIDISSTDVLAEIAELDVMLATLVGPHTVRMQADIDAARAAISRFTEQIGDNGSVAGGAFMQKMRAELLKASQTLPDIQVGADTTRAMAIVSRLRAELATLSARVGVDVDAATALARLETIRSVVERLDNDDYNIDVDVRVDLRNVLAQLTALATATQVADAAMDNAFGDRAVGRISRFRLIMGAVAVLLPIIAGAVVALPAALALMVGPALAVAAGVDGIKNSFAELKPEIDAIRETTSQAFELGLEPTIDRLHTAIPQLQDDLAGVAFAVSDVAEQITNAATEAEALAIIEENFALVDAVVRSLGPSLALLTRNMIDLTNIGLAGMIGLGEEMRQVGEAWAGVIARLQASGAGTAAVQALFQVLAELLTLVAGLTEFGAVLAATFGPALAVTISGLAAIFSTFARVLDALPEPLQTVASAATFVGLVMLVLGTRVVAAATAMRTGLVSAGAAVVATFRTVHAATLAAGAGVTGLGVASRVAAPLLASVAVAGRALLLALGGPVGLAITAIVIGLSMLGAQQANAAAAADQHRMATQQLAEALRTAGGAIDSNVLQLTRSNLEAAGAAESADTLGYSLGAVSSIVARGGPAYDSLITKLREMANENIIVGRQATQTSLDQLKQKESAEQLLGVIEPMRQSFLDAAAQNKLLGEALALTGNSMVRGVATAKALEESFAVLRDEMASVDDRAKALYQTLILLSGQALPLGLAQGALGQATRDVAEAFKGYAEATKASGDALLDHTGKINVASEAGFKLTQAVEEQVTAMTNSATSAFEAAGGMSNVAAASAAASREVEFAREAFIKQAQQMGLTGAQAAELADRYGLIPSLVVTQLRAEGIPQVNQDLLQINQLIKAVPDQKIVNIGVPSAETIAALQGIGVEIRTLPSGQVEIVLQDQAARDRLAALVQSIEHPPPGPPKVPVALDPATAQAQQQDLENGIRQPAGGPPQLPVGANPAPLNEAIPGIQGTITGAPPAGLPVETNPAAVPPQVADIQAGIQGTVAAMPINPIKGSGWDMDLAAIQASIVLTVGTLPINPIKGSGWDPDMALIRDSVSLGPPVTLPLTVVRAPTWPADLAAITGPLMMPPYTALLITVMKAPTFEADLQAIRASINAVAVAGETAEATPIANALLITVAQSPTFAADLAMIKASINAAVEAGGEEGAVATTTALLITVAKSPAFDVDLAAIKASINGPQAALPGALPGAVTGAPALLITVAKSPMFDITLAAIKASINGGVVGGIPTTGTPLYITPTRGLNFDMALAAIKAAITTPPALPTPLTVGIIVDTTQLDAVLAAIQQTVVAFLVAADVNPAIEIVIALLEAIQQTVTFFTVVADTVPAQNAVIELVNWISSLVVPITVIAQFGGFGGMGMASGGVVQGGQSDFDAASAASQRLTGGSSFPSNGGGSGTGGGFFNPGAGLDTSNIDDLRNAMGRIVVAMASGGTVGSSMQGGIAAVVPPNTWRVIGDRVRDDEAYIPINAAARSHSILAYTASRMGYNLSPQASGSFMTQRSGSFSTPGMGSATASDSGGWGGGGAPLIGTLVASPSASATDLADEVMFRLRVTEYGGVNGVRR